MNAITRAELSGGPAHPRIFMAAGEVSGDRQAAHLARAVLALDPATLLYGSGGEMMRQAGVEVMIQTSQYGSVGISESLRYFRPLRRVMENLRALIRDNPPDIAVLVDNEGFNGVLARFLYDENIPLIYYFPPQVWLWGEWRAKAIARRAATIIPAFPAEVEIYRREGGHVEWFGHPLLDIVKPGEDRERAFRSVHLDPSAPTIALMPGSRYQEIDRLTGPMLDAARLIKDRHPTMQFVIPLAALHLLPELQQRLARAMIPGQVSIISHNVYTILKGCDLAILSSGTATLEAALLGLPMVVVYRVSATTFFLAQRLVKSRFIAMPNILLEDRVVPELLQEDVTAERIAAEALAILEDSSRSDLMRQRLANVRPRLGSDGALASAARLILSEATRLADIPGVSIQEMSKELL